MMKILFTFLIIAVLTAHAATDPNLCSEGLKSAYQGILTKCNALPAIEQSPCFSGELRNQLHTSQSEFKPFMNKCPDLSAKDCWNREIESACPGFTKV